jgi:PhnB protein
MPVKPIPDGYHSVTPYLIVKNAAKALDFYAKAFGAKELFRMPMPDGTVGHAEIEIGNSRIMLADEAPAMGFKSPDVYGGTPVSLMIYVENVNDAYPRALKAGGRELKPLQDQFYGDRSGTLADPFGHVWTIATHVRDVPMEEMKQHMDEMANKS